MENLAVDENGDVDPEAVSKLIKETFDREEVRLIEFPHDILTRAEQQGLGRGALRASSRRYIAMRMSDPEGFLPDASFEGLPLEFQTWLEINIIQYMPIFGSEEQQYFSCQQDPVELSILSTSQQNMKNEVELASVEQAKKNSFLFPSSTKCQGKASF